MASVAVARIVKSRGIRGEVVATLLTDFPDRFADLETVTLRRGDTTFVEQLEKHWFHKDRIILKFQGRNRPHEVQELVGCEVQVPASARHPLPEDTFFDDDLLGCDVIEGQQRLGRVARIYRATEAVHNLVVGRDDGQEFMIPLVAEFVLKVDLEASVVSVRLPEGLEETTLSPAAAQRGSESGKRE